MQRKAASGFLFHDDFGGLLRWAKLSPDPTEYRYSGSSSFSHNGHNTATSPLSGLAGARNLVQVRSVSREVSEPDEQTSHSKSGLFPHPPCSHRQRPTDSATLIGITPLLAQLHFHCAQGTGAQRFFSRFHSRPG